MSFESRNIIFGIGIAFIVGSSVFGFLSLIFGAISIIGGFSSSTLILEIAISTFVGIIVATWIILRENRRLGKDPSETMLEQAIGPRTS